MVKASGSAGVSVSAKPPTDVPPGTYAINVRATVGDRTIDAKLTVEITGTNALTLTTPDQRLSNSGSAGSSITQQLVVQQRRDPAASSRSSSRPPRRPTGPSPSARPTRSRAIAAGEEQTITATVMPSNDAIAGDYVVTYRATTTGCNGRSTSA